MSLKDSKIGYGLPDRVTTDAVHRRFLKPKPINDVVNETTENENELLEYFFCQQCNLKVCKTEDKKGLKLHFQNKKHEAYNNCVYCKKPVYEYIFKKAIEYYHHCNYDND